MAQLQNTPSSQRTVESQTMNESKDRRKKLHSQTVSFSQTLSKQDSAASKHPVLTANRSESECDRKQGSKKKTAFSNRLIFSNPLKTGWRSFNTPRPHGRTAASQIVNESKDRRKNCILKPSHFLKPSQNRMAQLQNTPSARECRSESAYERKQGSKKKTAFSNRLIFSNPLKTGWRSFKTPRPHSEPQRVSI